jgi:hypothetical protein
MWPETLRGFVFSVDYFRRVRKIAKRGCQLLHVRLLVRMEQLGSHWTEFDET